MKKILLLIIFLSFVNYSYPQEKRLALVIGNGIYEYGGTLANPENDAQAISNKLKSLGFDVMGYINLDQDSMRIRIDEFGVKLKTYDVGLFFYAGHGIQVNGNNYLIPCDANLDNEKIVEYNCVRAGRVLANMEAANSKTNIVILDACRDNPFERSWNRGAKGKGLAFMNAPSGSLIAYATSPGSTAADGAGVNGLYTEALLQYIGTLNLSIEEVFKKVRTSVKEKSFEKQIPWESTSLEGSFYFLFDENVPFNVEEEIASQWVVITSEPTEGDLYIDDRYIGQTPYQQEMKEGNYTYRIIKDLYQSETGQFNLIATEGRKIIDLKLKPNFGTLKIDSYPESGAAVTINGKPTGKVTPFTRGELTSGKYTVTLRKQWYETHSEQLEIGGGDNKEIKIDMKPVFGEISITTHPISDIYIDGDKKANGTYSGRLTAGLHILEAKKDKYNSAQKKTEIMIGSKKEIILKPLPKQGLLKIVTTPYNALIELNGKDYGTSPQTIRKLLIGTYTLELSKAGYDKVIKQVEIKDNKTTELNVTLKADQTATVETKPKSEDKKIKSETVKEGKDSETTPEKAEDINKKSTYESSVNVGKIVLMSSVVPGLGLTKLSDGKPYWLIGVAGTGCIASSIYFNRQAYSNYNNYLDPNDEEKIDTYFDKAKTQDNLSKAFAITAAAIWVTDLVIVGIKASNMNKSYRKNSLSAFSFGSYIESNTDTPMLSLYFNF